MGTGVIEEIAFSSEGLNMEKDVEEDNWVTPKK